VLVSFFAEIRRRKVFQVAAVYAVVAWLLVQVVATIEQPLNLPEWFATVVIVSLAIGFPVALILAWAFDMTPQGLRTAPEEGAGSVAGSPTSSRLNVLMQTLVLLAVALLVADQYLIRSDTGPSQSGTTRIDAEAPPPQSIGVRRYRIDIGRSEPRPGSGMQIFLDVARDGQRIVYSTQIDGQSQLYVRDFDQLDPVLMPGIEGRDPSLSFDGNEVVFRPEGYQVHVANVQGGSSRPLTPIRTGTGIHWTADGWLYFTDADSWGLARIPVDGGAAEPIPIASRGSNEVASWPHVLPGGSDLLVTLGPSDRIRDGRVELVVPETGESRTLFQAAYNAKYIATSEDRGHIVFVRAASLWAAAFDLERQEVVGPETEIVRGVQTSGGRGAAAYGVSDMGTLVYLPGTDTEADDPFAIVLLDRAGNEEELDVPQGRYGFPRLSHDDRLLAVSSGRGRDDSDVYIEVLDLEEGTSVPLLNESFDVGRTDPRMAVFTPDNRELVFFSYRDGGGLYQRAADGSGRERLIIRSENRVRPQFFSPSGSELVVGSDRGLHLLSLDDPSDLPLFLETAFVNGSASLSPDGRWLAYAAGTEGGEQIYVRPFPDVTSGGPWKVSTDGGREPLWSANGDEIFYRRGNDVMAVSVSVVGSAFRYDSPVQLFSAPSFIGSDSLYLSGWIQRSWDITADGRFLMIRGGVSVLAPEDELSLVVVENWFDEVRARSPRSVTGSN
jgi:Tol biopolymer transport system component